MSCVRKKMMKKTKQEERDEATDTTELNFRERKVKHKNKERKRETKQKNEIMQEK